MAATASLKGHRLVLSGRLVGPDLDAVTEIGKQLLDLPERQLTVDLSYAEDTLDIAGIQWLVTIYRSERITESSCLLLESASRSGTH